MTEIVVPTQKTRSAAWFALAGSLLALLLPAVALAAEDGTRMPGAACKLRYPQSKDTTLYSVDEIYNSSLDTVDITCPMPRAVIDSSSLEYASVLAERSVTCTLLLMTEAGDFYSNPVPTSTEQLANGLIRMVWAEGDYNVYTPAGGTYTFLCTLPPQTGVYNYYVIENDGEE
jgi:hypothetical protein